jgi:hypothetical protein
VSIGPERAKMLGDFIRGAGVAMWGDQWVNPMARALGMSTRSLRRTLNEPELLPDYAERIRKEVTEVMRHRVETILLQIQKEAYRG